MADIEADVIIVGSGVSGALLAAKLSQAGVRVAILEAGARVDRAEATQRFWNSAIRVPECPYPPSPEADHPISNDPDYWYGPDKFRSTYLKVVGGTTWHWFGTCLRFVPNDFRLASAYGRGTDWPIAYDELEPFYGQAEKEIGVSGDSSDALGSPRSEAYPMAAIPPTFMDKTYAHALAGTEFEVRPSPQARNSVARGERPAGRWECELHPHLPDPSEIRCNRAPVVSREERRRASCANNCNDRRGGARQTHLSDPLQALGWE
jgi:glucose dehydrogenase